MPRVLLLHTNRSYATTLAATAAAHHPSFDVDVVSRVPLSRRLHALATGGYDLVQVDEMMVNGVLAAGSSLLTRVPLVVAIRGWADYTNEHGEYGRVRAASIRTRSRFVLDSASAVVFISGCTAARFREVYPVATYRTVHRPIDIDRYAEAVGDERDTLDLLTATNLRYEAKFDGVVTVLRALEPLFDDVPRLRFRIAGGGAYLSELESFLEGYPHASRVEVLGFVDDVEREFASADCFVYVSYLDAYPTVVLEAQAAGLPVVGGDALGVPEAVGEAGLVCEPSVRGVREALSRVLSDPDLRERLRVQSREKMATYNRRCTDGHVRVWRRALPE